MEESSDTSIGTDVTPEALYQPCFPESRHITFDFTLLDEDRLPRSPLPDEIEAIKKVLPPYSGIGVLGPFLVIRYQELPPKPWPFSVAGLPLFLTTDHFGPWFFGRPGRIRYGVLNHLDARRNSTLVLYNAVIDFFQGEGIPIKRIMWVMGCWSITVPGSVDISVLPGRICQTATFYLFRDTLIEAAFRKRGPRDDSYYSPLRPGVMLASDTNLTTSGVLVKNENGDRFMTVSSHGFPATDPRVYHPNTENIEIGQIVYRLDDTDIALVELRNNVAFENHMFQSNEEPSGIPITNIRDPFRMQCYDALLMDNPFTGLIDGQFFGVSLDCLPTAQHAEHQWVKQVWAWFGQDPDNIPGAGSCGSAITDSEGGLVCFFRWLSDNTWGVGVSAQELVQRGFTLAT